MFTKSSSSLEHELGLPARIQSEPHKSCASMCMTEVVPSLQQRPHHLTEVTPASCRLYRRSGPRRWARTHRTASGAAALLRTGRARDAAWITTLMDHYRVNTRGPMSSDTSSPETFFRISTFSLLLGGSTRHSLSSDKKTLLRKDSLP